MSTLDDLDKLITVKESTSLVVDAESLVNVLKSYLRRKLGDYYVKVIFDKTEQDQGVLFIKFAGSPWKEATTESLENSNVKFIVAVSGFDGKGKIPENTCHDVDMYVNEGVRKLKRKKFYDIEEAKRYMFRYFEKYCNVIRESLGTASGATSAGVGGVERTEGDIAVKPVRMGHIVKRKKDDDEK